MVAKLKADALEQACEAQPWFADYVKALAGIADKSKGRKYSPLISEVGGYVYF